MVSRLLGAGPVIACSEGGCARLQVTGSVHPVAKGKAWLRPRYAGWHKVVLGCDSQVASLALELRVFAEDGRCMHRLAPACSAGREQFYRLVEEVGEQPQMCAPIDRAVSRPVRDDGTSARLAAADVLPGQPTLGRLRGPWRDVLRLGCARGCTRVPVEALLSLLRACVDRRINLALCVVNDAMAQGSTMLPTQFQRDGSGWTLAGRSAHLQIFDHQIADVFAVRCPQHADSVSFVDVLDRSGALVLRLRGRPKPGLCEPADWRQLIVELLALPFALESC